MAKSFLLFKCWHPKVRLDPLDLHLLPTEVLLFTMPGYSYFALSVICLLTFYIPLFWALGEFKDTSQNMKRFFIAFMPVGVGIMFWVEYAGLDWGRVGSNLAYAAFGSLFLALIHKFSRS
jgi:hypothetical protein